MKKQYEQKDRQPEPVERSGSASASATKPGLDRRSFLKGGLTFGAAAFGAAIAPKAAFAKGAEGLPLDDFTSELAGTTWSDAEPVVPLDPPATWDDETEVVVVGSGGGGLAAALYLATAGKKVIMVEKNPSFGGETASATAMICYSGTRQQNERGVPHDVDKLVDSFASRHIYPPNGHHRDLLRQMIVKGPEFIDWFIDQGAPMILPPHLNDTYVAFEPRTAGIPGMRMVNATNFASAKAAELGADCRLLQKCTGLVMDGERAVGIKAMDLDSRREYYIKASTAVVLAGGGMASNRDMLQRWIPTAAQTVKASMCYPGQDGFCQRLGLGAGADMDGWDSFMCFCGGLDVDEWNRRIREGDVQIARQPWLGIDNTGKRYPYISSHDEKWPLWNAFTVQAQILQSLPNSWGYVFFDAKYEDHYELFAEGGCRAGECPSDTAPEQILGIDPVSWRDGVLRSIERGFIKTGSNFSELAEQLEIDPAVVNEAVNDWNAMCEKGKDPDFNFDKKWLIPLENPPYYAMKIGAQLMSTYCGLRVSTGMAVIDTKGKPIPGLFAASNTIGGVIGNSSNGGGECDPLGCCCLAWTTGYVCAQGILGETV